VTAFQCIFCDIIEGKEPAYIIYEDEKVIVFLDKRPVNPGHLLVVPKKHYRNIFEIPEEILSHLIIVVKKMSIALKEALNASGVRLIQNNERCAGQEIFHIHFHVIPYYQVIKFKSDKESVSKRLISWIKSNASAVY